MAALNGLLLFLGNTGTATTTTLTPSPNPSAFGQTVTLAAAVTPNTATGTLTFQDSGTILGSANLSNGAASIGISTLTTGSHSLAAVYSGDATNGKSSSSFITQVVDQAATSTSLTSSVNPSVFGQGVTFSALVSPPTATGTFTFKAGTTTLGSTGVSSGRAQFGTFKLPVGPRQVTAVYSGDTNYLTSTSPVLTQVVDKAPTETKLVSSPNPSNPGKLVMLTANVLPVTATGTVTFVHGSTVLGTGTLRHGQATYSTSVLTAGPHALTAVYEGDGNDSPSRSASVVQTVN